MGVVFSDFRHGQAGGFNAFETWREALEAAGLSKEAMAEENVEFAAPRV